MLIGELSKRSGFTRDAIRFYEKQGYIKVGRRERRVNNYKEYSEEILKRLLLFKKIKSYGFTLNESAEMIALTDAKLASCDMVQRFAYDKVHMIEEKIKELSMLKNMLTESIDSCVAGRAGVANPDNCPLFHLDS